MVQKRINKSVIELTQGDITHQVVDVIVNAANSSLLGGGGVDGAIHRAGGPDILDECKQIRIEQGCLETGKAVVTTAGKLKAKKIVHTVGPVWQGGNHHEPELLAGCYRNSLKCAEQVEARTIAFPSISTGAYGYPVDNASMIALRAVSNYLKADTCIEIVRFVLFDVRSFEAFKKALSQI